MGGGGWAAWLCAVKAVREVAAACLWRCKSRGRLHWADLENGKPPV